MPLPRCWTIRTQLQRPHCTKPLQSHRQPVFVFPLYRMSRRMVCWLVQSSHAASFFMRGAKIPLRESRYSFIRGTVSLVFG